MDSCDESYAIRVCNVCGAHLYFLCSVVPGSCVFLHVPARQLDPGMFPSSTCRRIFCAEAPENSYSCEGQNFRTPLTSIQVFCSSYRWSLLWRRKKLSELVLPEIVGQHTIFLISSLNSDVHDNIAR